MMALPLFCSLATFSLLTVSSCTGNHCLVVFCFLGNFERFHEGLNFANTTCSIC